MLVNTTARTLVAALGQLGGVSNGYEIRLEDLDHSRTVTTPFGVRPMQHVKCMLTRAGASYTSGARGHATDTVTCTSFG